MENWLNTLRIDGGAVANASVAAGNATGLTGGNGWLQDFALAADLSAPGHLLMFFFYLWIIGILIFAAITFSRNRNLLLIKESVKLIENRATLSMFTRCKAEIGVKANILLGTSILVKAPMTMGLFKPIVVLPAKELSLKDTRYAMLHELAHCKNKDITLNCIMLLFQTLYWFNPLVHLVFAQMRLDRELACDAFVLDMLPSESHFSYGETLLNFMSVLPRSPSLCLAPEIGGSKPQITKRIKHIASYTADSGMLRVKSICVFVLIGFLVFLQIPFISVLARGNDDRFHFHGDNVRYVDLAPFFEDFDGSFVLYDLDAGQFTIHNRDLSETRVSPFSTYKIYSALIALEIGVLDASSTSREWDGTMQPFESWNQDHDLASAMQYSVSWYFQDMDAQVGIEGLRYYLTRLSYGNNNLSGGISDFWNMSSLLISPIEQVKLLTSLHQNNSVFETRHIDTLRYVLRLSERDGVVLSGKTGTGLVNGWSVGNYGWFIGYVETEDGTFIFATFISGDDARGSAAAEITLSILGDMGVYNDN